MKAKKAIATLLALTIIAPIIPQEVLAQTYPVVSSVTVPQDDIINIRNDKGELEHKFKLQWDKVVDWDCEINVCDETSGKYRIGIADRSHGQEGGLSEAYFTPPKDYKDNAEGDTITVEISEESFNYRWAGTDFATTEAFKLESGKLYELFVVPIHYHSGVDADQKPIIRPVFNVDNNHPKAYTITDFDTQVSPVKNGIKVSWEYIEGIDYTISYAPKKAYTIEEFPPNLTETRTITADQIEIEEMVVEGRVEYIIDDVELNDFYSIYVKAVDSNIEFIKDITDIINNKVDNRGPKVVIGTTAVELMKEEVGVDKLKISWENELSDELRGELQQVKVYQGKKEGEGELIAILNKPNPGHIQEYVIVERPSETTYYTVEFIFKEAGNMQWDIEAYTVYTPGVKVKPVTPVIPNPLPLPFPRNTEEERVEYNNFINTQSDYLVSSDESKFDPLKPSEFQDRTFHSDITDNLYIQLVWDAPKQVVDPKLVDYDLEYDLWISTEPVDANTPKLTDESFKINESDRDSHILYPEGQVVGFKYMIEGYKDKGDSVPQPLKTNTTYYIQLQSKRIYNSEEIEYSDPVQVNITIDKNGHIFTPPVIGNPPLMIKEDENGSPVITQSEITIEWPTKWWEVLANKEALEELYADEAKVTALERKYAEYGSAKVYTPESLEDPLIRFREPKVYDREWLLVDGLDEACSEHDLIERVNELYKQQNKKFEDDYYHRHMLLDEDVNYELAILTYEEMNQLKEDQGLDSDIPIEEFVGTISPDAEINTQIGWKDITPQEGRDDLWVEYTAEGLMPSTEYVLLFRAYRQTEEGIFKQDFPSYVIGTTKTDYDPEEPVPTVPTIRVKNGSETDTSFVVYWEYNKDFDYELRYSIGDDPENAKVIALDEETNFQLNGKNGEVTLYGLFPETTYHVWIKAKQRVGTLESAWSNPAIGTTEKLQAPDIPTGLGEAAYQSIVEAGHEFDPVSKDYITVEWNKDKNDQGEQVQGTIKKNYQYDIQISKDVSFDNTKTITVTDALETTSTAEVISKSLVKFINLKPNSPYYFKIRARVILEDEETGKKLERESDFSKWVRIDTSRTDDEYDGGENENVVIYPDSVEEDLEDGIWEWVIVDAQTVISEIVTSNDYFYTIDMDLYNGRYDAIIRRIKIPVSVLEALIGQKMELRVVTHRGIYEIPAKHMAYMLRGVNAADTVQLDFHTILGYDMRDFSKPYPYEVQGAEKLTVKIKSKQLGTKELKHFDGPITVKMKLESPTDYHYNTFKTYTYDVALGEWMSEQYRIENQEDATYMVYSTSRSGIYTLYKIDTYAESKDLNYAMQELLDRYNIEGFGTTYRAKDEIEATHYVQILLGIAQDYVDITLSNRLSEQQYKMAVATDIYVEDGEINQEQALHGIVRLYEMQTGYRVKPSSKDVSDISPSYRESISKAYALGIIEDIEPNETITYGELSEWLMLVIR